ncbi:MAG: orotidine 5-phosphate decarboxylase [Candidatus Saccharibacteria bacterium]|nr:orotidine 5-phosphate decarboxylase [Candidatus Saccharibacteria bacterium]
MAISADPYERIIWSADVDDVATLTDWVDQIPKLRLIKIDRAFVDRNGWDVFDILRERGVYVFDDAKITEIPTKLELVAKIHVDKARPWMLNCMAGSLSTLETGAGHRELDGLRRFADVCAEADVHSCAVSVLTSKSEFAVESEFNGRTSTEQVLFYAERLVALGITHLVCSPREAEVVRKYFDFTELQLVTPGVRPVGEAVGDQARVSTPESAIKNGANYLVVGRPITQGKGTPAENLDAIAAEIQQFV